MAGYNVPFVDWSHPYMENVFNGFTAGYSYIKIECATIQAIPSNHRYNPMYIDPNIPMPAIGGGANTMLNSMEVVCMKNLFEDDYQGFSPPNPNINTSTGSILGCGDDSNGWWNDAGSWNGPGSAGGYGWQYLSGNPLKKGNSAFGDTYGINWKSGINMDSLLTVLQVFLTYHYIQNIGPSFGTLHTSQIQVE